MTEKRVPATAQRNVNLDLIRSVAAFSVLGVHFFLNVPFYEEQFVGKYMWALTILRSAFLACVPLFALLSGYLCCYRKPEKGYAKKLIPILMTYLLACLLTQGLWLYWGQEIKLGQLIFDILNVGCGAVAYSWYVEMYIGLLLLIPFLNALYHGLESKENKKRLILVLLILTAVPTVLNNNDWRSVSAFFKPGIPEQMQPVFPTWWTGLWPLTYYFIGAYVREYGISLSVKWNVVALAVWLPLWGSVLFYRSYKEYSLYEFSSSWGSLDKVVYSVLLFLLLLRLDLSRLPGLVCRFLGRVSKLSFGIYLCSYATDIYIYSRVAKYAATTREKHMLGPVAVLASFFLAMAMSQLIQWILEAPKLLKKK